MGWLFDSSNTKSCWDTGYKGDNTSAYRDSIRDQIRDLEYDMRYLEKEAYDARCKSESYWKTYSSYANDNNFNHDSYADRMLNESNYWGNVNADTQRKIDNLEDKIRDLERGL